ncbi:MULTISPECIES: protein TolR [Cysteiniphilum]|uniref:Tol-Pal system protein TolR n=1 Tax=Cysteiniphilum litorale TaxID=2056700 RepID=A0A8J2Z476_9GAMM|nr:MULTISPECIES: protein TolR [Cysteiniphilum]WHN66533.1 protein TolR [Cysteiniphilum sp. QT6929]GGF95743.1 protein TolR [Cysteiniphilum litorale]
MRRRNSRRTKRKAMVEINVVPYIDVMLVLLIIFMITAPMLTQGVKVDLPQAQAKKIPPSDQKPLIVTVNQQGQYFINRNDEQNALTASQLSELVATTLAQDKDKQIYVRGDKNASYGQVVEAMVLLQKAGVASVGLVTDDPKE